MKVLVTGSRDWTDEDSIKSALWYLPAGITLIHGDCRGADKIAAKAAEECGMATKIIAVPADWVRYGKAAGPKRNTYMIDNLQPDLVLAFHPNMEKSRGTWDCVSKAFNARIPVVWIRGH